MLLSDIKGRLCRNVMLLLLLLVLAGCAAKGGQARERFFWPPLPREPRIEFIRFILADTSVTAGRESLTKEYVFGKEKPAVFMARPVSIAAGADGRIFVGDHGLKKVLVLDFDKHEIRSLLKEGEPQPFGFPNKIVVTKNGDIWAIDTQIRVMYHYDRNEIFLEKVKLEESAWPVGFAIDEERNRLYVADVKLHQILVFDLAGQKLFTIGQRGIADGQFNSPTDLVRDGEGNLYVLDALNARVQVFDREGRFLRKFGERGTASGSFAVPKYLALSPAGHLYVTDSSLHKVVIFDLQGQHLLSFGGRYVSMTGELAPGGMNMPEGVAVDAHNGIWLVDSLNGVIQEYQYLDEEYLRKNPPPVTPKAEGQ